MPIYSDVTYQMCGNNGPWDNGSIAATLDSTGAPTVNATAAFTGDYPSGVYTLSWQGTGKVTISGTGVSMGKPTVTTTNGVQQNTVSVTLTQNTSQGSSFSVQATTPVTNIHLMVPATNQTSGSIFNNDFINKIHPFSTLRFMDALNTNGNLVETWSQRTWPTAGSRGGRAQGMAYEDIVALANQTGKDVWINIPVLATDDYVCRVARLFKYGESGADDNGSNCSLTAPSAAVAGDVGLNANSHVYVEFTNEEWNWGFQQVADIYCMANGGPASYSCSTGTCYHTCDVTAPTSAIAEAALNNSALNWGAVGYGRTEEMAIILTKRNNDIFKTVFGSSTDQVKTIFNVQAAYAAEADSAFAFLKAGYGSVADSIDYMAVAPYFSPNSETYESSLTTLFSDLANVLLPTDPDTGGTSIYQWIVGDLAEANKYELPLIAYESGQSLDNGLAIETTAQSDPRMYTEYLNYLAVWDKLVGRSHLINQYEFTGDGNWGALVNSEDPGSQKWDALLALTLIPGDINGDGTVNQEDCTVLQAHYGQSGMWRSQGDLNHDGSVNAEDLAILNTYITGQKCTAP
jgi:Dockerin type I domain